MKLILLIAFVLLLIGCQKGTESITGAAALESDRQLAFENQISDLTKQVEGLKQEIKAKDENAARALKKIDVLEKYNEKEDVMTMAVLLNELSDEGMIYAWNKVQACIGCSERKELERKFLDATFESIKKDIS